jgi:hypothetical protein
MSSPTTKLEGMKEAVANTAATVYSGLCEADKIAAWAIGKFNAWAHFERGPLIGYTQTLDEAEDTLGIPKDLELTYLELRPLLPRGGYLNRIDLEKTGFRPFEERIENLSRVMDEIASAPSKDKREKKIVTEQKLFDLEAELLIQKGKNQEEILKALHKRQCEIYDPNFAVPDDIYTEEVPGGAKENRRDHIFFGIRRSLILKGYATENSSNLEEYLNDSLEAFQTVALKSGSKEDAAKVFQQRMKTGNELKILSKKDDEEVLKIMVEAVIFASEQEREKYSGKDIDTIVPRMVNWFCEAGLVSNDSDSYIDFVCAVEAMLDDLAKQNRSSSSQGPSSRTQTGPFILETPTEEENEGSSEPQEGRGDGSLSARSYKSVASEEALADEEFNWKNPLGTTSVLRKEEVELKGKETRSGIVEIQGKIQERQDVYIDLLKEKLLPENIKGKGTPLDKKIVEILGEIEGLKAGLGEIVPRKEYWGLFSYELLPTVAEDASIGTIAADIQFQKQFRVNQKVIAKKDKQIADVENVLKDDRQVNNILVKYDKLQSTESVQPKLNLKTGEAPAPVRGNLFERLFGGGREAEANGIARSNSHSSVSGSRPPSARSDKSLDENAILVQYETENPPVTTTLLSKEEVALKDLATRSRIAEIQERLIEEKTKQLKSLKENIPFDVESLGQIVGQEAEYRRIFNPRSHKEFLEKDKEITRLNKEIDRPKSRKWWSLLGLGTKKSKETEIAEAIARLKALDINPAANGAGVNGSEAPKEGEEKETPGYRILYEKLDQINVYAKTCLKSIYKETTLSDVELLSADDVSVLHASFRYLGEKQKEVLTKYPLVVESLGVYYDLLLQKREALLLQNQEVHRETLDNDIEAQFKKADQQCDELIALLKDMRETQRDSVILRRSASNIRKSIKLGDAAGGSVSPKIEGKTTVPGRIAPETNAAGEPALTAGQPAGGSGLSWLWSGKATEVPKEQKLPAIDDLLKKKELMDESTELYCNLVKNNEELSATSREAVIQKNLITSSVGICLNLLDRLKRGEKISDRDIQEQFQNANRLCNEQINELNHMIGYARSNRNLAARGAVSGSEHMENTEKGLEEKKKELFGDSGVKKVASEVRLEEAILN